MSCHNSSPIFNCIGSDLSLVYIGCFRSSHASSFSTSPKPSFTFTPNVYTGSSGCGVAVGSGIAVAVGSGIAVAVGSGTGVAVGSGCGTGVAVGSGAGVPSAQHTVIVPVILACAVHTYVYVPNASCGTFHTKSAFSITGKLPLTIPAAILPF